MNELCSETEGQRPSANCPNQLRLSFPIRSLRIEYSPIIQRQSKKTIKTSTSRLSIRGREMEISEGRLALTAGRAGNRGWGKLAVTTGGVTEI